MQERQSQLLGDRQSVVLGERSEPLMITGAGKPGAPVMWYVAGMAGRMDHTAKEVGGDGVVSGEFVPYGTGEAEVSCIVGNDYENAIVFRISCVPNPDAPKTLRPSMMTRPSGVPAAWRNEITDAEVSERETVVMAGTGTATETRETVVMPVPMPEAPQETAVTKDDGPITAEERRSIVGSKGRQAMGSKPVLAVLMLTLAIGISGGILWLMTRPTLNGREATQEATRRSAVLQAERAKIAKATPPPAEAKTTVDLSCSTAPIRVNPDGTLEMEVCVD